MKDKPTIKEERISLNVLTKFERASIIGFRASQLRHNDVKPYINVDRGKFTPYEIAKMELRQKVLPYLVKRSLPNGKVEVYHLKELIQFE
jgi:DNA-directed RNA polymerase subunit K/omega